MDMGFRGEGVNLVEAVLYHIIVFFASVSQNSSILYIHKNGVQVFLQCLVVTDMRWDIT